MKAADGISRTTTLIFAVAAGVAVANIYYLQPILAVIASDLHATPRTVGFVASALQVGYAIGILAFVPLGDLVQRRGLIVGLFSVAAVCLACASAAANITLLALAICAVVLVAINAVFASAVRLRDRTRARGRNDSGGADHRDGIRASGKRPARCVCRMAERVSLRRHPHGDFGDRAGAGEVGGAPEVSYPAVNWS